MRSSSKCAGALPWLSTAVVLAVVATGATDAGLALSAGAVVSALAVAACARRAYAVARSTCARHDRGLALDVGIVVAGALAPVHVIAVRSMLDASVPVAGRALVFAHAAVAVGAVAVLAHLLLGRVRRSPSTVLLLSGVSTLAWTEVVHVASASDDPMAPVGTMGLLGPVVAFALVGAAALASSRVPAADEVASERSPGPGPLWAWVLGAAVLVPFGTALVSQGVDGGDMVLPTVLVAALVVARLRSLAWSAAAATARVGQREEYFRVLAENVSEMVMLTDAEGIILDTLDRERFLAGYVGKWMLASLEGEAFERPAEALRRAVANPDDPVTVLCTTDSGPTGEKRDYELTIRNMLDVEAVGGVVWMFRDVTERVFFEQELIRQALHDSLTGLPNRVLFADRLAHSRVRRGTDGVAVLFVDLDNFKHVNDSLGHDAGDALLRTVARRFQDVVRQSDTVARLGGDEFAVLVELASPDDDGSEIAQRLLAALREPVDVLGNSIAVTASVGVTKAATADTGDILAQADIAMYQAKAMGKNAVVVFEQGMQTAAAERMQLGLELADALAGGQMRVAYQPIVDLADDRIVGVEALLRWDHPTRGTVPPLEFIPTAEENGLIVPIGRFVLVEACRQVQQWSTAFGERLTVSVNLSALQLEDDGLVDDVRTALAASGLAASDLVLELTESVLVRNVEASAARLTELKRLGVRLAIDDFGTGYSSLSYLRQFPIDVLKIDRSFVASMVSSHEANAVVRALVDMGRTLHLETLAEGVEEQSQADLLRAERCGFAQGFLFAAPMAPNTIADLLTKRSERGAVAEV